MPIRNLILIEEKLKQLKSKYKKKLDYCVPERWTGSGSGIAKVNPFEFYLDRIEEIKKLQPVVWKSGNWSDNASVYNLFVRYAGTFDHFQDNDLLSEHFPGFRGTGTFLKAIALLPYIHQLSCNTIYLLPVTSIGIDRKKGNLGSPYAIRNHYLIEPTLSEPVLELGAEIEMAAFSEAVHLLNMKFISEFVFRTSSVDSDIALEHPEWYYWIKAKINERTNDTKNENQFGPPIFTSNELALINDKISAEDFTNLQEPHDIYKKMFTKSPAKLARVEQKIIGLINNGKTEIVIPSAFADWPPDDRQPLWSDVTYLKLYEHKDFNYIAYNTVRMYDKRLAKDSNANTELWEFITNIIPHYIKKFKLDGIMLDMGHALPSNLRKQIVEKARQVQSDFVFWEENFSLSNKSCNEGYNAVVGYMPFDSHIGWKIKDLIRKFQNLEIPINFFLTPENHNTPRAASRYGAGNFAKCSYLINKFLPSITFIHNGFELFETNPVNTGLGFDDEQIKRFQADQLPLFSAKAMNWTIDEDMIGFISNINSIFSKFIYSSNDLEKKLVELIETDSDNLIMFKRFVNQSGEYLVLAINLGINELNWEYNCENNGEKNCLLTGKPINKSERGYMINLPPFDYIIFK